MAGMPDDGPLRGSPKAARSSAFGKTTERIQRGALPGPRPTAPLTPGAVPTPDAAPALPVAAPDFAPASPPRAAPVFAPVAPSRAAPASAPLVAAPPPPSPFARPAAPVYDAVVGEQALLSLMPRLNVLSADQLERPRADLELVALGALALARTVREPNLRARFRALPPSEFDPEWLELLEPLAWALWHVHRTHRALSAASAAPVVPVDLSEAATELERRMQTCVEYHLADHPEAGAKVAFLRVGTGYRDLAGDLMGYAELYREHRDELCHDRKHYRAGDADEAVVLATRLFEAIAMGQGGDQHRLALRDRAWTLLARCYEEIVTTGRWLLRRDPFAGALFPSLQALGRPGGGRPPAPAAGATARRGAS